MRAITRLYKGIGTLLLLSFLLSGIPPVHAADSDFMLQGEGMNPPASDNTGPIAAPGKQDMSDSLDEQLMADPKAIESVMDGEKVSPENLVSKDSASDDSRDEEKTEATEEMRMGSSDQFGLGQDQSSLNSDAARTHAPNVQQNTGNLVYEYPILVPPGRNGMQPDLKLTYESQGSSEGSMYGTNWVDNIPYVQRYAKRGVDQLYSTTTPQYFVSSWDGELATTTNPALFVARTENGSFRSYLFTTSTNQWTITDKAGTKYKFGYSTSTRQDDPNDGSHVFRWMLEEARDTNDNYVKYTYTKDSGNIYPSSIVYTGNGTTDGIFEVDFVTTTRADVVTSTRSGFSVVPKYLINRIDVKSNGSLVRQYALGYGAGDNGVRSLLTTAVESGKDELNNTITLPTTTFGYQSQVPGWSSSSTWFPPALVTTNTFQDMGYRVIDVNGDSLADIIRGYDDGVGHYNYEAYINNGHGWTSDSNWYPPISFSSVTLDTGCRLMDANGDGLMDIIRGYQDGTNYTYEAYINNGHGWTSDSSWNPPVAFSTTNGRDLGYKIADYNGDGLPDFIRSYNAGSNYYEAYINNGHGWTSDSSWNPPVLLTTNLFHELGCKVFDANGDGLADLICSYYDGGSYTYSGYINNGHGWTSDPTWAPPITLSNYSTDDVGYRIMDVNGDGLPDMVRSYNAGPNYYEAYINNGHGWTSDPNWYPPMLLWINTGKDAGYKIADLNGDGLPDMVRSYSAGPNFYEGWIDNGNVNSLLKSVTYPEGGKAIFTYKPAAQYVNQGGGLANRVYSPLPTLTAIALDDGFGNVATTTYSYSGGRFYYGGSFDSQFAGFASTTVTDPQGNITYTYFHQADTSLTNLGEYNDNYFKIGKPFRIDKFDASAHRYSLVINKWDSSPITNSDGGFVKLAQAIEYTFDGDATHADRAETYAYDSANGNLTQKVEYGKVTANNGAFSDTGTDLFTTNIAYASSASSSVLGAIKQITVLDQNATQVKDTKYTYDGMSFGSIDKGNQTKQEDWKVSSSYINSQKSYDAFGLVATSTDPRGKVTSYEYDAFNLYPASVTDALGHKTRYQYDYTLGKPKQVIDADGLATQTTYDGLDRVTQIQVPDLTTSSTLVVLQSYLYTDTAGSVSVKDSKQVSPTSTVDSYSYYDGFGRLIQKRTAGMSAQYEVKDILYNSLGLPFKESLPYFSTGTSRTTATSTAALFTTYSYDAVQRLKTTSNVLGTATTTYNDWKTTITDPNGKSKDLTFDAYKRLVQVGEHNGVSTYSTAYQYDGNGSLTKMTDALGNVRNFTYDALGRRLTAEDLHVVGDATFGTWAYSYDDTGNLATQIDPKGQTINYTYDDLNRPLTEDYTGVVGTEVAYTYDACSYGIGSLCSVSSTSIQVTNTYNPRRLLASETKTIDGTSYTTAYTYDLQGNQLTITNPDSSQIKYEYAGGHFLSKVSKKETTDPGFVAIVNSFDYAPNEQASTIVYANGVTQSNTYDAAKLYRLTRKVSTLPNTSKAQDLTYTYDSVGNITQLVEAGATNTKRTVAYGYDDLYRLTSANVSGTSAGISGYNQAFTYDALGNFTNSNQGIYLYFGNSGSLYANPHAATLIGGTNLKYDNNGNLLATGASAWSVNGGNWSRRRLVTIDHTKVSGTSTLVNFPILVTATDPDYKTVANGGLVASSTGGDIFFTSADGVTKLNHEIEQYVSSTGAITAWVQVPSVTTSTDTLLYMYYGNASSTNQQNATDTWDSYTKGVWHFNNSLSDSSSYANNGVNHGTTDLSGGKIAGARDFAGAMDTVTVSSSVSLQPSSQITLSSWIKAPGEATRRQNIAAVAGGVVFNFASTTATSSSFTITGTNPVLIASIWCATDKVTSATWNGTSMTLASKFQNPGKEFEYIYYLANPATTTSAVVANASADCAGGEILAEAYSSAGTPTQVTRSTYTGTSVAKSLTVSAGSWVVGTTGAQVLMTPSTGVTARQGTGLSLYKGRLGDSNTSSTGGTMSMTWTGSNTTQIISILELPAAIDPYLVDNSKPIWYGSGSYGFLTNPGTPLGIKAQFSSTSTSYSTNPTANLATSTWQYLVTTYDGTTAKMYLNGSLVATNTAAFQIGNYNATSGLSFGSSWANDINWDGSLDEVRVASTTRSADWIKTEYNNQSTSTMVTIGPIETNYVSSTDSNVYTWDYLNRLVQATVPGSTSTYAYDTSNERIKEVVATSTGTVTTYYPTKFYNITSGIPTKHVFANGTAIATIVGTGASSTVSSILTDHLTGSSVVTDASGSIIELSDYLPFGGIRIDDQSGFNEQRKFAGHEYDGETGLSYQGARYYNMNSAKFLSEDQAFLAVGDSRRLKDITRLDLQVYLTNPQALNAYTYSYNNPLIYRDPTGRFAFLIPLGALAVESAPVWAPAAITWAAAAGLAITGPLVGGEIVSYARGDSQTGDAMANAAMMVYTGVAAGVGIVADSANQLESFSSRVTASKNSLTNDTLVCRGGTCTAERFKNGTGVTIDVNGKLQGVSVNSFPGASIEDLMGSIPNKQVGVTTVGNVRSLGGDVFSSPTAANSTHSTLQGVTPEQAESLFTPTRINLRIRNKQ